MNRPRIALGIRAQLLLVLTVFLALPWLGYGTCANWSAFCATRRSRRWPAPRRRSPRRCTTGRGCSSRAAGATGIAAARTRERRAARRHPARLPRAASPEIAQIIHGLSRTTARIWVVDREQHVLARAGSLRRAAAARRRRSRAGVPRAARAVARARRLHPLYARVLQQPTEDFRDERPGARSPRDATSPARSPAS